MKWLRIVFQIVLRHAILLFQRIIKNIEQIYDFLTLEKIHTINPIVVRNEGVYDVPDEKKSHIKCI